jgi:two-component system sensor histidine kinase HydH
VSLPGLREERPAEAPPRTPLTPEEKALERERRRARAEARLRGRRKRRKQQA